MAYQQTTETSTLAYVHYEMNATATSDGYCRDYVDDEEKRQQAEQLKLEYEQRCEREARRTAFPPVARIRHQSTQRVPPVRERCSTRYPTGFG